ncbi:hypothetical protein T35B1_18433 [Salinisphaera shabanensis T35B1]|uniref:E2/UBC family protein n=1 Tax=Salinisphaera shabanensis TaxID=180542 RepID=UPI00333EBB0F
MMFLPSKDRRYLKERDLSYREVEDGTQKGVIFPEFRLPDGKFHVGHAEILIILPAAYPDAAPDMFYALPHLTLAGSECAPRCTQARLNFEGRSWQRWSRHNGQWRPGVDGLQTMLKRIEEALEIAA